MNQINAYLMFDGNCAEAMKFYQKCLKAELHMMPFSEVPGGQIPPEARSRIMHARLSKGSAILMASDIMPGRGTFQRGDGASISINCESKQEVDEISKALQEGGKVTLANHESFWGAYFGMLTDKFGVDWMFNYDHPKK